MGRLDTNQLANEFISRLHALEADGAAAIDALVDLFSADAELVKPPLEHRGELARGPEGVAQFWTNYRAGFSTIHSEFGAVTTSERMVGLFWRSRGSDLDGNPIEYEGATLLAYDDAGRIRFFRGYFDPAELTVAR